MYWCKSMVWFQVGLVLVILCHKFNRRCLIQITSCSKRSCQNINLNKIFTTHIFPNFWIFCWIFQSVDSVLLCLSWLTGKFLKKAILGIPCAPLKPGWFLALLSCSFADLLVSPAHTNEWLVFIGELFHFETDCFNSFWLIHWRFFQPHLTRPESLM